MASFFSKEILDRYAPGADCIPAMKIWKIPEEKNSIMFPQVCNSGQYFSEIKKDGYWYQFEKTPCANYLFSRNVSKQTGILTEKIKNVPHIEEALNLLPVGTTLIGEIYYPRKTSKDVTKIMGCLPQEAIKRQKEVGKIHYYLHDIIKYNGQNLQQEGSWTRYLILKQVWEKYQLNKFNFLELARAFIRDFQEETARVLNEGEEGMVFKRKDAPYTPNERPAWMTLKVKKMDFIDAVCIGFCDPTKEYTGKELNSWEYNIDKEGHRLIGFYIDLKDKGLDPIPVTKGYYHNWKTAMKIGAYNDKEELIEIGTIASGLTDELRSDFSKYPEKYLNKVVSIQCMQKDNKEHTLRHGFFKNFREDKDASDCRLQDIF